LFLRQNPRRFKPRGLVGKCSKPIKMQDPRRLTDKQRPALIGFDWSKISIFLK
jgi:hypothetical protein